jgi:hypothetical protein
MMRGFLNRTAYPILAGLMATLLFVQGCHSEKPATSKPPAAAPAKIVKPRAAPEPAYPEPDEADEEDEPTVDAAAIARLSGDWVWLGTVTPTSTFKVDKPSRYRMTVYPRGWFALTVDCMKAEGVFEARAAEIAFAVVQQTAALGCTAPPLLEDYIHTLESARRYRVVGDRLRLQMKRESKEMVFYRSR